MKFELDRRQMNLYRNVILDVISGPFALSMRSSLGDAGLPMYRALFDRINRRLWRRNSTDFRLDAIDLAALRAALTLELQFQNDTDFYLVTGRTLEDARVCSRWRTKLFGSFGPRLTGSPTRLDPAPWSSRSRSATTDAL